MTRTRSIGLDSQLLACFDEGSEFNVMKLCLLTLLICSALFSYCCSPNTPAHYVMASASGEKLTGINTEYLCQHWVNSYEEEPQTNKGHLYRPKDFKEFPASRFRMQYIFYKDGTCKWFYLDPTDGHHFKPRELESRSKQQKCSSDNPGRHNNIL